MKRRCECELCLAGKATSHNDDSHDQSLDQTIAFAGKSLRIVGGTTKCARSAIRYFERMNLSGKRVIEFGSGTGLVGLALHALGADVTATDQDIVLVSSASLLLLPAHSNCSCLNRSCYKATSRQMSAVLIALAFAPKSCSGVPNDASRFSQLISPDFAGAMRRCLRRCKARARRTRRTL